MIPTKEKAAVTGAFGYSGQYIAQGLLEDGNEVLTLTNSPGRHSPLREVVQIAPLQFQAFDRMVESLKGCRVLYNTYWVRFNHRGFTHRNAVENSFRLFDAAQKAGVERIVHVSITNPSLDSPLEYFRGKAEIEKHLTFTEVSHAILRPTVLFGAEDILINNIAWSLRRFPVFGLFGDGSYKIQPVYVRDLARLAITQGVKNDNNVINAIGPETFSFKELVAFIGRAIGTPRPTINLPPPLAFLAGWCLGKAKGDVLLTWPEMKGLMGGLLQVGTPSPCPTKLTSWAQDHADILGTRYHSELKRRQNRELAYSNL